MTEYRRHYNPYAQQNSRKQATTNEHSNQWTEPRNDSTIQGICSCIRWI